MNLNFESRLTLMANCTVYDIEFHDAITTWRSVSGSYLYNLVLLLILQHKIMQMMYAMIYKALKEAGLENKYEPQDYLNFFCLGNREAADGETPTNSGTSSAAPNTPQVLLLFFFFFPFLLSMCSVSASYLKIVCSLVKAGTESKE